MIDSLTGIYKVTAGEAGDHFKLYISSEGVKTIYPTVLRSDWLLMAGSVHIANASGGLTKEGAIIALRVLTARKGFTILVDRAILNQVADTRVQVPAPIPAPYGLAIAVRKGGLITDDEIHYAFLVSKLAEAE